MVYRVATRQIYKARKIKIGRMLPAPGEILVQKGQQVSENDTVGQTTVTGSFVVVNVAQALGLQEPNIGPILRKDENDTLEEGEIIAEAKGRLPFSKKICKSPVKGRVAAVAGQWLLIETEAEVQAVKALVAGQVVGVYPTQGVVIETVGTYIEATYGFGGEAFGLLQSISDDPKADIDENAVTLMTQPAILWAGGTISERAVREAEKSRVSGVIVGSINATLLEMDPPSQIPIVATEGFGNRPMAPEIWETLQARCNDLVSIQGLMSSVKLPVIIIPGLLVGETVVEVTPTGYMTVGSRVRTLREPEAMSWGRVSTIQEQPQSTVAAVSYRGAEVSFPHGTQFVPWLNLEQIG